MTIRQFEKKTRINAPRERLAHWHDSRGAFARLSPPWTTAEMVGPQREVVEGMRAEIRMRTPLGSRRWIAQHEHVVQGHEFTDVQIEGPFAGWRHTHRFSACDDNTSELTDQVEYALPLGKLGELVAGRFVGNEIDRMFTYRHETTANDLDVHARYHGPPLRIAITGSTGMVGAALTAFLTTGGHEVIEICRRDPGHGNTWIPWSSDDDLPSDERLEGLDAVVHLAGESIAAGRWTAARKKAIHDSRADGTQRLVAGLVKLAKPPRTLISASAIGLYGDRGDACLSENSDGGEGFLADVCRAWETATDPASAAGTRVVNLRIGVVLSASGGALRQSLPVFRAGLGGRIGHGRQWMSWISLDDLLAIVLHCIRTEALVGPVNAVAPNTCTNAEFTKSVAGTLGRPAFLPLPATAARLVMGELADALLLASTRVVPTRLEESNFVFHSPSVHDAIANTLGYGRKREERDLSARTD